MVGLFLLFSIQNAYSVSTPGPLSGSLVYSQASFPHLARWGEKEAMACGVGWGQQVGLGDIRLGLGK